LILGSVVDRRGAAKPLIGAFVLCACLLLGFSHLTGLIPLAFGVAFLIGMCGVGAQLTINALAARFYETKNRSTGVGWALGIGRFGSVAGPLTGALLFRPAIGLGGMLELVAAAAFLAALAIYVLGRLYPTVQAQNVQA
jgi:AAHS family 4-hydroxybenzoate transporter-like MFS transporter